MVLNDPYTPDGTEYECSDCGRRLESPREACGSFLCDGSARNVSVARE